MRNEPRNNGRIIEQEKALVMAKIISDHMKTLNSYKYQVNSPFPIHLAFGHEKLAACVALKRKSGDKYILTHRNIHFNLALSSEEDINKLLDESMVKETGINNGVYGCMTMRNQKAGIVYTSSILGNNLSVGLGVASTLDKDNAVWIQMGDGSIEEGSFCEGMIFAKARKLRVILIIENNNWSLGSSIKERRNKFDLKKFAESIGCGYSLSLKNSSIGTMLEVISNARLNSLNEPQIVEVILQTEGGNIDSRRGYVSYHHGIVKERTE